MDTTTSPDPDYNDSQLLVYGQSDSVAGSGSHRGYNKRIFKNGDETYGKYEGTHKRTSKEGGAWEEISAGKWQVIGGTGKFKNIKGSGTYKGKRTAEGGTTEFEGEVEY